MFKMYFNNTMFLLFVTKQSILFYLFFSFYSKFFQKFELQSCENYQSLARN